MVYTRDAGWYMFPSPLPFSKYLHFWNTDSRNLDARALLSLRQENPETKCLLIDFREEQSKASLIGAFMLARAVSRRRKVQIGYKNPTAQVLL